MYSTNFSLNITWSILASIPQWIFYLISQADTHYGTPPEALKTAYNAAVFSDPELVECDCDWQVHVNGDCTEAIICHSACVSELRIKWLVRERIKSNLSHHRLSGGRQQLTCREGTTISINYLEQQWVCTEGDNCPPNIGGVIMGCPLDPPPVIPGNSTGRQGGRMNILSKFNRYFNASTVHRSV